MKFKNVFARLFSYGKRKEVHPAYEMPTEGGEKALIDYVFKSALYEGHEFAQDLMRVKYPKIRAGLKDVEKLAAVYETACIVAYGVGHSILKKQAIPELVNKIVERAIKEIPDYRELEHRAVECIKKAVSDSGGNVQVDMFRVLAEWVLAQEIFEPGQECSLVIKSLGKCFMSVFHDCTLVEKKLNVVSRDLADDIPSSNSAEAENGDADSNKNASSPEHFRPNGFFAEFRASETDFSSVYSGDYQKPCSDPNAMGLHRKAALLSRKGQMDKAYPLLRAVVQKSPDFSEAWFNIGTYLVTENDYNGAREAFETAIRYRPRYGLAIASLRNLERMLTPDVGDSSMDIYNCLLDFAQAKNDLSANALKYDQINLDEYAVLIDAQKQQLEMYGLDDFPTLLEKLYYSFRPLIFEGFYSVIKKDLLPDKIPSSLTAALKKAEDDLNFLDYTVMAFTGEYSNGMTRELGPKGRSFMMGMNAYAQLAASEVSKWAHVRKLHDEDEMLKEMVEVAYTGLYKFGVVLAVEMDRHSPFVE